MSVKRQQNGLLVGTERQPYPEPKLASRIDGVDLLRGLAIFFVLMNHINMQLLFAHIRYLRPLPPQLAWTLAWNGQYGVQIFFAVSGFLITATTLRRWGSLGAVNVREFYLLRVARIAPLFLGLLAVLSVLHLAKVTNFVVPPKLGGLPAALVAALTFRVNVFEATRGYLPGNWDILWSLGVEEAFYLFFPLLARGLGRVRLLFPALLLVLVALGPVARAVLSHGNEVWQEYSYLGSTDAIALGCLAAVWLARVRLGRLQVRAAGVAGAACLGFILCFSIRAHIWGLTRAGLDMTVIALGTVMVIVASVESGWRAPVALGPVLALGRRSYEVYLTHMFVVLAVFHGLFLPVYRHLAATPGAGTLRWVPLLFLVVILLAGLLGELVARFFSEPANRALRARFLPRRIAEAASPLSTEASAQNY